MRKRFDERSLCEEYRIPLKLIPLHVEMQHGKVKGDFTKAVTFICDSQIKWLLKRGWMPPEMNGIG